MASKAVKEILARHQAQMMWVDEILWVKRTFPAESQAEHVRTRPVEYWIGFARGVNAMTEEVLRQHRCYAGFQLVYFERVDSGVTMPFPAEEGTKDAVDWRIQFFVK